MINNANIIRSIFLSLFLCLIHNLNGQTATPEYALEVSDAFFDIQYGITPQFEDITPIMNGETTCLYQTTICTNVCFDLFSNRTS